MSCYVYIFMWEEGINTKPQIYYNNNNAGTPQAYFTMNFIELYYILSLLRYMYMYMHILLLSSLLSLLFKLYVLVYQKYLCV